MKSKLLFGFHAITARLRHDPGLPGMLRQGLVLDRAVQLLRVVLRIQRFPVEVGHLEPESFDLPQFTVDLLRGFRCRVPVRFRFRAEVRPRLSQ